MKEVVRLALVLYCACASYYSLKSQHCRGRRLTSTEVHVEIFVPVKEIGWSNMHEYLSVYFFHLQTAFVPKG